MCLLHSSYDQRITRTAFSHLPRVLEYINGADHASLRRTSFTSRAVGRSRITCAIHKRTSAYLARHPLQELTVPSYVPNDTFLIGGSRGELQIHNHGDGDYSTAQSSQEFSKSEDLEGPSMLMMTGPNYSGKSVYLKQIALIVYMAHVGCFVPAAQAIIGLTDKILTRIATRETVSRFQSAFMIDLQQVALAMTQASHRSLIVIDEFGKGTESNGMLYYDADSHYC